jgi:hypothetical protein
MFARSATSKKALPTWRVSENGRRRSAVHDVDGQRLMKIATGPKIANAAPAALALRLGYLYERTKLPEETFKLAARSILK